ncbi:MAG: General secretion pathway protein M [uncultured bacterium]|nr:MAG: General secretion pathway protein M [uncultured bacterium]
MKEQWLKIKEWWSTLAAREKQAVMVGSIFLSVFIVYQFMWSPLLNHLDVMRKRIKTDGDTLVWMQAAEAKIKKIDSETKQSSHIISPVALMSVLQKQIESVGLAQNLSEIKQESNDSVAVHFQKVEFDKLIVFLATTVREQHIIISQFTAIADATPGLVNADIVLKIS